MVASSPGDETQRADLRLELLQEHPERRHLALGKVFRVLVAREEKPLSRSNPIKDHPIKDKKRLDLLDLAVTPHMALDIFTLAGAKLQPNLGEPSLITAAPVTGRSLIVDLSTSGLHHILI
ncbi:hypothetical protein HGM15179_007798 [Zosterops borbonicus]|uniref:Uncharacterized protein n=1 Tax=Zosterops borbonicus TaxID=364589 RepID=A0A8K1GI82_9PASS|nr:hypothetical protein HGM15179_007798 [Zosterops borbonicus]